MTDPTCSVGQVFLGLGEPEKKKIAGTFDIDKFKRPFSNSVINCAQLDTTCKFALFVFIINYLSGSFGENMEMNSCLLYLFIEFIEYEYWGFEKKEFHSFISIRVFCLYFYIKLYDLC